MSHGLFEEPNVTLTLKSVCPQCGKVKTQTLTLPRSIADVVRDMTTMLCDPCGNTRKAEEERKAREQAERDRVSETEIPSEFLRWDDSKGNHEAANWVNLNRESNLLLVGEVDTGKTRAMVKVLLEECHRGKKVLFLEFNEFAERYAEAMQESISSAKKLLMLFTNGGYDVIMLDDIDKRRINETAGNLLYKLFNKLYEGSIASRLWFTINHNGKEFLQQFENRDYGAAVISRIDRMMKDGRFVIKKLNGGKIAK